MSSIKNAAFCVHSHVILCILFATVINNIINVIWLLLAMSVTSLTVHVLGLYFTVHKYVTYLQFQSSRAIQLHETTFKNIKDTIVATRVIC